MVRGVRIADRTVGPGQPCFIIAEAGVNHNGNLELAKKMVDAAAQAKADAVKFQTFRADRLANVRAPKALYQKETTKPGESQQQMLKRLELSQKAHRLLWEHCQKRGILFLSTPFEEESAHFLYRLGVAAFKIASGEVTNLPFLACLAQKGRPLILSTGMSTSKEVTEAVETIHRAGNRRLVLLHCVSNYPAEPQEINLRAMEELRRLFQVPVGFSDHTLGIEVALAAAALGASVIEKHFTLDRSLAGPDHPISLQPKELAGLVQGVRKVEAALGDGKKRPALRELVTAAVARKSLVAAKEIPVGTRLTQDLILIQRPGTGLAPKMLSKVVGCRVLQNIPAGTLLTEEMLE